jgi:hypothetical protein
MRNFTTKSMSHKGLANAGSIIANNARKRGLLLRTNWLIANGFSNWHSLPLKTKTMLCDTRPWRNNN